MTLDEAAANYRAAEAAHDTATAAAKAASAHFTDTRRDRDAIGPAWAKADRAMHALWAARDELVAVALEVTAHQQDLFGDAA